MKLVIRSSFSSAHFYHQPLWSDEKNRKVFGRCFTPYGHGHDYVLEVSFTLPQPSGSAQEIENQRRLKQPIVDGLTQKLDHQHLNLAVPAFKEKIPTTENIALYFIEKLREEKVASVRLFEKPDLWTEIHL